MAKANLRSNLLAESLQIRPPPSRQGFNSYTRWANQVLPLILEHRDSYRTVAYIMMWKSDGTVIFLAQKHNGGFHLNTNIMDHTLDPTRWPSPSGESMSIRVIGQLPWRADHRKYINTTMPLHWRSTSAYLSMGYPATQFYNTFFQDERQPLLLLLITDLLAGLGLTAMIWLIKLRFDKSRAQYTRTVLARTSLLSERGMLASVLAHEVRSPLTALGFNLHFLRGLPEGSNSDTSRQTDLIESCEREVRRLDLMLDDFLTRTQIVGEARDASVNTVVTEALDFLRPAMASQDIRVITHLDPADPHVQVSSDELRQVLLNLCTNAQEAMPRSGTLAVSTMAEAENVVLLVRDSGKGIPPEVQERMFDPFFTTKPHGSGLGLALVRRVVTGAGGSVFYESEVKHGTTFRIVLPRTVSPTANATASTITDQRHSGPRVAPTRPPMSASEPRKG